MAEISRMHALDVWYATHQHEKKIASVKDKETQARMRERLAKARSQTVLEHLYPELVVTDGSAPKIKDNPPLIFHHELQKQKGYADLFRKAFAAYRETLPEHRRILLDRFKFMDIALKVVGVGSVGTACAVMLFMANEKDPLFLQLKEAGASVLEPYAGKSQYANHGQRVVSGCHLMQSASDLFLGWTEGGLGRHFYVRQLKDMKIKAPVEVFTPTEMKQYAEHCGRTLARAHARSGEPAKISGYMGKTDTFDEAIADFSVAYADQSERDHDMLKKAVRNGRLEVATEAA